MKKQRQQSMSFSRMTRKLLLVLLFADATTHAAAQRAENICPTTEPTINSLCSRPAITTTKDRKVCYYDYIHTSCDENVFECSPTKTYECSDGTWRLVSIEGFGGICPGGEDFTPANFGHECDPTQYKDNVKLTPLKEAVGISKGEGHYCNICKNQLLSNNITSRYVNPSSLQESTEHYGVDLQDCSAISCYHEGEEFDDETARLLAKHMIDNQQAILPNLQTFSIQNTNLGPQGARVLAEAFSNIETPSLIEFSIRDTSIGSEGATALAKAIEGKNSIQVLTLSGNAIGDEGAKALASAIESFWFLKFLALGRNQITDEGMKSLADVISDLDSLTDLYLNDNQITEKGASRLLQAIEINESFPRLEYLELRGNEICDTRVLWKLEEASQWFFSEDQTCAKIIGKDQNLPSSAPMPIVKENNASHWYIVMGVIVLLGVAFIGACICASLARKRAAKKEAPSIDSVPSITNNPNFGNFVKDPIQTDTNDDLDNSEKGISTADDSASLGSVLDDAFSVKEPVEEDTKDDKDYESEDALEEIKF